MRSFTIRLEDYEHKLADRTLYLVARYAPANGGEWWDNNDGQNFRVGFRRAPASFSQSHSHNLAGMGLGMGMSVGAHSQQRTFSAPTTLKTTPTTAQDRERARAEEIEAATARMAALAAAQAEADRERAKSRVYAPGMVRSASLPFPSSPSPPMFSIYTSRPSEHEGHDSMPTSPAQAFINKRLSLSNYVAPGAGPAVSGSIVTPPMTPPNGGHGRARSSSLPGDAGLNADTPEKAGGEAEEKYDYEDDERDDERGDEGRGVDDVPTSASTSISADSPSGFPLSPSRLAILASATIIGGQPATTLEPLDFRLQWSGKTGYGADLGSGLGIEFPTPGPAVGQEQLLSPPSSPSSQQPELGLGLDVGEPEGQRRQDGNGAQFGTGFRFPSATVESSSSTRTNSPTASGASSPALRDPSYAALIRNWCFTGSPMGSPVGTINAPFASGQAAGRGYGPASAGVYGFPGVNFGMADAGIVGGECLVSSFG